MSDKIEQVKYIQIEIDEKTFKKIFDSQILEYTPANYSGSLDQIPRFIRFTLKSKSTWYMDITITKIIIKEQISIILGQKIDYRKPRKIL